MRQSVGRTGVCYDNAMAESFFAAVKIERVHRTAVPDPGTRPERHCPLHRIPLQYASVSTRHSAIAPHEKPTTST